MTTTNDTRPVSWRLRRAIWNRIAVAKYKRNKPVRIPVPSDRTKLVATALSTAIPKIPIDNALVGDSVPPDEVSRLNTVAYRVLVALYTLYPAMQKGLPSIPDDIDTALAEAYTPAHRRLFPAPALPGVYAEAEPELGDLAAASPYAAYLEYRDGELIWDLSELDRYEVHPGLYPVGSKVTFELHTGRLKAKRIDCELGSVTPHDPDWTTAKRIAMSAVSGHIAMVRHFNWVHLAGGGPFSIATRNALPNEHPIKRGLWAHMFGTQYSNELITRAQLAKGGDFESIFAFTHEGMCALLSDSYDQYRITVIDPHLDWETRGLVGLAIDAPVQANWCELFDVMHAHAERYVAHYYESDDAVLADNHLRTWLTQLDEMTPNGVTALSGSPAGRAGLARLMAGYIYLACVQHDALGTLLWNYQMWVHKHPVRVYRNGSREPLDVYQRLVNANFNLNVNRAQLLEDYSYLAVDEPGRRLFRQFFSELQQLEERLVREPPAPWRLRPSMLEANINA